MTDGSERDTKGRFAPGNQGGPGGARRRTSELRRAAEDAISPEVIQAAMRKCARLALEGNLAALRIMLDRACGRAAEAPVEAPSIALPRMHTAADCSAAIERIVDGITKGTIEESTAKVLLDAVQARLKAIEATDHEVRLAEVEKALATVDLGAQGRR